MAKGWLAAPFQAPLHGGTTTREGGVSQGAFAAMNLSDRCGDDLANVAENRRRIGTALPAPPLWLHQVHGARVIHADQWHAGVEADAIWTDRTDQVLAILSADCLPILIGNARQIAAVHAGWRGLAAGVVEAAIEALPEPPDAYRAWIGPCIRAVHYEVGAEVRDAFADFPDAFTATRPGHWRADLVAIASARLLALDIGEVIDSRICSYADRRWFSHRRDPGGGRMASLIWREVGSEHISGGTQYDRRA